MVVIVLLLTLLLVFLDNEFSVQVMIALFHQISGCFAPSNHPVTNQCSE